MMGVMMGHFEGRARHRIVRGRHRVQLMRGNQLLNAKADAPHRPDPRNCYWDALLARSF